MNVTTDLECRFRPRHHFAAERNWLNDPNGLLYANGRYHLFFQHNPFGDVWGNMSWGHATSTDLVNWVEQAVAIPCDEQEAIYSGSAVLDVHNTSGFGTPDSPPLVAIYTSAYTARSPLGGRQAQSLAYSTDDGMTWTKYAGNPVLDRASAEFRDPKVFWYDGAAGSYWVMVAVEAQDREVVIYKSSDLKSWDYLSSFGPANATAGVWECPDLFELAVDGNAENSKWVLIVNLSPGGIAGGSGGQYFVGEFDGVTFRSESTVTEGMQADDSRMAEYGWLDWGRDYYAAVSFNNAPGGRRLMIGWMNNWQYGAETPTTGWRSAMSLVREVRLVTHSGKTLLLQNPVMPPGERLFSLERQAISAGTTWLSPDATGEVYGLDVEFEPGDGGEVGLLLRVGGEERTVLAYDATAGVLRLDRRRSGNTAFQETFASIESVPVLLEDGRLRLHIQVDRCSVEVFAQDGLATITELVFPGEDSTALGIFAEREGGTLVRFDVVH
ncbi:glycoside hydrolase family 32 protein [Arthrobacter sp. 2RAF6]|uniref:glycoside hydrolase family 32 protein n=1 Tax=Arthrobacter sp. 2RAF6 TaxID=3233002 RepID=UPI003F9152A9